MLQIYNTLGRKKEEFVPLRKNEASFYQCGPTVYWTQHLGNMRAMVLADFIVRSFTYLGYKVKFVRNYTDVGHLTSDEDTGEDKLEKSAKKEGLPPEAIADKYIAVFENDLKELNTLSPWQKPRATEYIKDIAKIVQELIDKGYAYATDLAIYFEVAKFENYTRLSGQDLEKNLAEAGKGEVRDPKKKNQMDFALWFFKTGSHQNALQTWPVKFKNINQPTAEGFPGWHIECSAMSRKILGETIDVHMGGVEHIPVHHTNEIAQSEASSGKKFVNYWLHNEHLTVDGGKMSKSAGTAYSLAEVKAKGFDPLAVRYLFCQAHYRSKQNFTWEALASAQVSLANLREQVMSLRADKNEAKKLNKKIKADFKNKFISAIEDDFNLPQALAVAWDALKSDLANKEKLDLIFDFDRVFGFDLKKFKPATIPADVKKLAEAREKARQGKDWRKSDELRQEIEKMGFLVEDGKDGYKLKKK